MLKLTKSYTSCYSLKNLRILLGGEPMPKKKWGKVNVIKKKMSESQTKAGNQEKFTKFENLKFLKN